MATFDVIKKSSFQDVVDALQTNDAQVQSAIDEALTNSDVDANYISYTVGTKPSTSGATEGTIGAYFTSDGLLQKLELQSGSWVDVGEPLVTKQALDDKASFSSPKRSELNVWGGMSMDDGRDEKPLVTFFDDDGRIECYNILKPILDAKGVTAGMAIPTDAVGNSGNMSYTQLRELQADGWEALSHLTTGGLGSQTESIQEARLKDSRDALEAENLDVFSLVPPFGEDGGAAGRRLTRQYYRSAFITQGAINTYPINTFSIKRINFVEPNAVDNPTLSELKAFVDEAVSETGWVVFSIHSQYAGFDSTQQQVLRDLIDYIQGLPVDIVNPNDALNIVGNYLDVGDQTLNNYTRIDNNGEIDSSGIGYVLKRGFDAESPITDFRDQKITSSLIQSGDNQSGLPSGGSFGVLETHYRTADFGYQKFYSIQNKHIYFRVWDDDTNDWDGWIRIDDTNSLGGVSPNAAPTDFKHAFVVQAFNSTTASDNSMPEGKSGTLISYTRGSTFNAFQEYYVFRSHRKFLRYYDDQAGAWSDWEENSQEIINLGNDYSGGAANPNALLATNYPDAGKIFVTNIWTGSDTTGLPESSLGSLVTYINRLSDYTLSYQEYHVRNSKNVYRRTFDSGAVWSDWYQIAGGASGSFTASSGETVTVEDGLITDIT
ncbi:MAG: hypothetical protein CL666_14760 [Balneola sp.]|nr:hypothetical protein [Balneola sp.]|tara:strand:+ start:18000 stop:19979 length:1980 start_codon:yes stop_codon:yes gene_type:complete